MQKVVKIYLPSIWIEKSNSHRNVSLCCISGIRNRQWCETSSEFFRIRIAYLLQSLSNLRCYYRACHIVVAELKSCNLELPPNSTWLSCTRMIATTSLAPLLSNKRLSNISPFLGCIIIIIHLQVGFVNLNFGRVGMKASTWSIPKGWLMSCSCEPTIWRFLHSNHTSYHHQFSWSHIHGSAFHLAGGRLARRRTFKKEHLGRNNGGGHLSLQLWRHRVFAIAPSSCRSLHSPASIPEPTGIFVIWKKSKLCNLVVWGAPGKVSSVWWVEMSTWVFLLPKWLNRIFSGFFR